MPLPEPAAAIHGGNTQISQELVTDAAGIPAINLSFAGAATIGSVIAEVPMFFTSPTATTIDGIRPEASTLPPCRRLHVRLCPLTELVANAEIHHSTLKLSPEVNIRVTGENLAKMAVGRLNWLKKLAVLAFGVQNWLSRPWAEGEPTSTMV